MTRQRIRQVEQANLHPVDGSLGVFGQVGQLLPRDVPAANERLLVEPAQHLLLQRLGRVRLRPQQHPSEFVNRYRWLLRHDPGLPQAPPRDAKRARQLSPSVVAATPAQYLVRHRCGRATPRRTLWSCHWSRPTTAH